VQNLKINQDKLQNQFFQTNDVVIKLNDRMTRVETKMDIMIDSLNDIKKNLVLESVSK